MDDAARIAVETARAHDAASVREVRFVLFGHAYDAFAAFTAALASDRSGAVRAGAVDLVLGGLGERLDHEQVDVDVRRPGDAPGDAVGDVVGRQRLRRRPA